MTRKPSQPERKTGDILSREYDAIFDNTTEGILVTDEKRTILRVNPGFTKITGYEASEAVGRTPSFLKSQHHDDDFFRRMETSLTQEGKWQGEIWNRRKSGESYPQWLTVLSLTTEDNAVRYIGIFTDITGYINNNNIIRNHAYYDSLTGLPNRMLLYDRLTFMTNLARRGNGIMGILLLDINRFKIINDTLGYAYGDQLLQQVASRLKLCTREVDSVFRLGDDEFAVLLDDIVHPQDAARVAKRIISKCSQPYTIQNEELYVTISIGVSLFPSDGERNDVLLKHAETAMLRAKEIGNSNYQHYTPSMNTQTFELLSLEHNLQKALSKEQFCVYYQPIINIATEEIAGAEALIRWQHPDLGMIPPGQFIPLAEETGLIIPIGEWVTCTACRQMRTWHEQFKRPLIISINLSARQFQQKDLTAMIKQAVDGAKLDPATLKLEITESIGMKNPERTIQTLNVLKESGIFFAIDDFGTGYSSLTYLRRFPIDTIKIDRTFIMEMGTGHNDTAIVNAMIALAHSLNLDVIAEGVETAAQLVHLRRKRCEQVQGFYFSKPVESGAFESLLRNTPWIPKKRARIAEG